MFRGTTKGSGKVYPIKVKMPIFKLYHTRLCKVGRDMWRRWILEIAVLKDLENRILLCRKGVTATFNNRLLLCVLRFEGNKGSPSGIETIERITQSQLGPWMKKLQDRLPVQLEEVPDNQYFKEGDESKGKREPDPDAALTEITKAYIGKKPEEGTGEEPPEVIPDTVDETERGEELPAGEDGTEQDE